MATTETVRRGLAWVSVGFGAAALVAPDGLARTYGIEGNPEARFALREWGSRNLLIGYLSLHASTPREKLAINASCAVLNTMDSLVSATSADLPAGFRARAALTSAVFAAGCAWLAVTDS